MKRVIITILAFGFFGCQQQTDQTQLLKKFNVIKIPDQPPFSNQDFNYPTARSNTNN